MDLITITCPRCGYSESYPHPDSVRERKECLGCVAEQLMQNGLAYWVSELLEERPYEEAARKHSHESRQDNHELSDQLDGPRPSCPQHGS